MSASSNLSPSSSVLSPRNQILGSTIVFAPYSLDQALEGLAAAGYTHCEVGAVKGWFEHIDPDTATDKQINAAAAKLKETGLTLVSMSGHTQLQTPEGKARFRRCLEIANELGASIVNTFTGDATTDEERAAYFANVVELCDDAKALGLKIGMETDSNMLPTAKLGGAILDRIDRPETLGFNYDPGNVVYYTGADPVEDIAYAIPRMVHFHFKDKIGGQGVFNFPPVGDGELPMARLLQLARDGGYTGPVSAEVEFDDKGWPDYDACVAAAKRSVANLHAMGITW